MKTVRQFINAVLEAGNWDIRDAFDDIIARDAEHEKEKATLRDLISQHEAAGVQQLLEMAELRSELHATAQALTESVAAADRIRHIHCRNCGHSEVNGG